MAESRRVFCLTRTPPGNAKRFFSGSTPPEPTMAMTGKRETGKRKTEGGKEGVCERERKREIACAHLCVCARLVLWFGRRVRRASLYLAERSTAI